MNIPNENWIKIPAELEVKLDRKLSNEDRNYLATALEECVSIDIPDLFQNYFKITPGIIQSIKHQTIHKGRVDQIFEFLDKWVIDNEQQYNATCGRVISILDKAKLIGIKQIWWMKYRDKSHQDKFKEHKLMVYDIVRCLSECHITQNEWNNLATKLYGGIRFEEKYVKNKLKFLNVLVENKGFWVIQDELIKSLKSTRLRRFVHKIRNPLQDIKAEMMGNCFIDYMEDRFHEAMSRLTDKQRKVVYSTLSSDNVCDVDEAFDAIVINGNQGFHKFYEALSNYDTMDIVNVFGNNGIGITNKNDLDESFFSELSAYENMKDTLESRRFLQVYGPSGSGKSVCAFMFAQSFLQKYQLSVVWFVECKDRESAWNSIKELNNNLCDAGISSNDKSGSDLIRQLVADLKSHDIPVLLIFDNVKMFHPPCIELCREFKMYELSFIIVITQTNCVPTYQKFPSLEVTGFALKESLSFLDPIKGQIDAAKKIADDCKCLPSQLALVKAFCEDNESINQYVGYLELLDTDDGKCFLGQELEIYQKRFSGICLFTSDYSKIDCRVSLMESKITSLEEYKSTSANNQAKILQDNKEFKEKIADLYQDLDQAHKEIEKLRKTITSLEENKSTNENNQKKILEDNDTFKRKIAQLNEELLQAHQEIEQFHKTIISLVEENKSLSEAQNQVEANLKKDEHDISEVTTLLKEEKKEKEDALARLRVVEEQLNIFKRKLKESNDKIEELKKKENSSKAVAAIGDNDPSNDIVAFTTTMVCRSRTLQQIMDPRAIEPKDQECRNIGYFWDIENCQVPSRHSAYDLVQNIRNIFPESDYIEKTFLSCVDTSKLSKLVLQGLDDAKVKLIYVSATAKNAADDNLKDEIRDFAKNYPPKNTTIVIITGDCNFHNIIFELRRKCSFEVVLIHKRLSRKEFIDQANIPIVFETLHNNLSPVKTQKSPKTCFKLKVSNLPNKVPNHPKMSEEDIKHELKKSLKFLSDNCGGKVLKIDLTDRTALMSFGDEIKQGRALFRFNDEDVFGTKIRVTEYQPETEEATTSGVTSREP